MGIFITIVYAFCVYLFGEPDTLAQTFAHSTNFLLWWYIITSIIIGVIVLLISVGITGIATLFGACKGKLLGGLLGLGGGGVISMLMIGITVISRGMRIASAYLLYHSITIMPNGDGKWDLTKLIIGIVLLIFSGVFQSSSSSSSNKDSSSEEDE